MLKESYYQKSKFTKLAISIFFIVILLSSSYAFEGNRKISVKILCERDKESGRCFTLGTPTGGYLSEVIKMTGQFAGDLNTKQFGGDFVFRISKFNGPREQEMAAIEGKKSSVPRWRNIPCPECEQKRIIDISYSNTLLGKRVVINYPFAYQDFRLKRHTFLGTAQLILVDGETTGQPDTYEIYFSTSENVNTYGYEIDYEKKYLPPFSGLVFKGQISQGDIKISADETKQEKPCWANVLTSLGYLKPSLTDIELKQILQEMKNHNPKWTEFLPACPLKSPSSGISKWTSWATGGFFKETLSNLSCFHPGAKTCFRSSVGYNSSGVNSENVSVFGNNSTNHCQQCCYDQNDDLIASGSGAGTPDFVCPSDVGGHWEKDVLPWTILGSEKYNQIWKPNQGMIRVFANRETDSGWFVNQGEEFEIENDLRTQIICEVAAQRETVICNSEGSQEPNFSKRLSPNIKFGALIGAVKTNNGYSKPFYIGSGARIKMPVSGKLVLGVNDNTLQDNSGYFAVSIRRFHN